MNLAIIPYVEYSVEGGKPDKVRKVKPQVPGMLV